MRKAFAMIMTLTLVFSISSVSFADDMYEIQKDDAPFISLLVDPPSYE